MDWKIVGLVLGFSALTGIMGLVMGAPHSPSSEAAASASSPKSNVVLRNVERVKAIRDRDGRLVELEIHREVESGGQAGSSQGS